VNEATDLESLVSQMVEPAEAPQEEPQAEEPEAVEAEAAEVEETPTQEESAEDTEAEFDAEDDFEFDLDDYQDVDQPQLYSVKSDGKEKQVTLEELKQGYAAQDYIQRTMQENAAERKETQQIKENLLKREQQVSQREQELLQIYEQAQQTGLQPPTAPSKDLFDNDPIGYMEAKIKYDEDMQSYNQQMQQIQYVQQQQQAAQQQATQQELAQQAEMLKRFIPELSDPQKVEPYRKALVDTGVAYDFSAEEVAGVTDARMVRVLNDAMKYRRLQAKRKAAQTDGKKPVVPSGAKRRAADGEAATRKKQQQKLRKSGKIEDALNLMLKP
jgi:hypothetical protein